MRRAAFCTDVAGMIPVQGSRATHPGASSLVAACAAENLVLSVVCTFHSLSVTLASRRFSHAPHGDGGWTLSVWSILSRAHGCLLATHVLGRRETDFGSTLT